MLLTWMGEWDSVMHTCSLCAEYHFMEVGSTASKFKLLQVIFGQNISPQKISMNPLKTKKDLHFKIEKSVLIFLNIPDSLVAIYLLL